MSASPRPPENHLANEDRIVHVACATDDNYAMPLSVSLSTTAATLHEGWSLHVHLLDGNISPENRAKLQQTANDFEIHIDWIEADFSMLDELNVSHHISHVAYYRLLLSQILPDSLDRILYLDCDLLVKSSVHELWQRDFGDSWMHACVDIACPYVDAATVSKARAARPYLATWKPIPNYKQLGIPGNSLYFNSGMLLINLAKWREEELCRKFIDALRDNEKFVWCWDQYALNVVLAGKWSALPSSWNQGAHIFEFPSDAESPIDRDEFIAMRDNPDIVHFTTEWKPWHFHNNHPRRSEFFGALNKTAWKGWQPERPRFSMKRTWNNFAVKLHKRTAVTLRKLANMWVKDAPS